MHEIVESKTCMHEIVAAVFELSKTVISCINYSCSLPGMEDINLLNALMHAHVLENC